MSANPPNVGATILVCYHALEDRRTFNVSDRPYEHCDYCLTLRAGTAGSWRPTVRRHDAHALYDRQGRRLNSAWNP